MQNIHIKRPFCRLVIYIACVLCPAIVMTANHSIRSPYVAGQFYPASKEELLKQLDGFLSSAGVVGAPLAAHAADAASASNDAPPRALIVPHAGYVYSGAVAGSGFSLLKKNPRAYKRIFILGANHNERARGFKFSLLSEDYYETPLGKVSISGLSKQLVQEHPDMFQHQPLAYQSHIVEVQLPFLQRTLENDDFEIIPIISGEITLKDLAFLSATLQKYVDNETLIIITADLSHYHPYKTAVDLDTSCTNAIVALDQEKLLKNETCGLPVIWALLDIAKQNNNWKAALIEYKNSGDTAGDKSAVVGYASIAFWGDVSHAGDGSPAGSTPIVTSNTGQNMTTDDLKPLLGLARIVLKDAAAGITKFNESNLPDHIKNSSVLQENGAAFVTLTKYKELRGCIGDLVAVKPLYLSVIQNTINAALYDPRFQPIQPDEIPDVEIEISVLTKPEPLRYRNTADLLNSLRVGVDGVILTKGNRTSTFLPQVWEQLPEKEAFLSHLCQKAGLSPDEWRSGSLQIQTYQVVSVEEER